MRFFLKRVVIYFLVTLIVIYSLQFIMEIVDKTKRYTQYLVKNRFQAYQIAKTVARQEYLKMFWQLEIEEQNGVWHLFVDGSSMTRSGINAKSYDIYIDAKTGSLLWEGLE